MSFKNVHIKAGTQSLGLINGMKVRFGLTVCSFYIDHDIINSKTCFNLLSLFHFTSHSSKLPNIFSLCNLLVV